MRTFFKKLALNRLNVTFIDILYFLCSEYTLITTPLPNGDEVNYQVIQAVNSDQQENIDPQTQVLMLQPSFTVASDQFGNDQNTQYEQVCQPLPFYLLI